MSEILHSAWPVLAKDGVGDAIGDARPIFVVSPDGRFLRFANAGGARFLGLAPARALDARVTLEPRLADRLRRFATSARDGDTGRELLRFFDGLRSALLSVGFRRLDADAILVTVDNARTDAGDADPAASLAAIAAEGGLVALFDGDGEVVAALGDHAALDGVQDEIEAVLDAEDGAAVFERTVEAGGRAHDVALVRLGGELQARRLLRVGPSRPVAARPEPAAAPLVTLPAEAAVAAPTAAIEPEPVPQPAPEATPARVEATADDTREDEAAPPAPILAPILDSAEEIDGAVGDVPEIPLATIPSAAIPLPEIPAPEVPPQALAPEAATEALAHAVAAVTETAGTDEAPLEPADAADAESTAEAEDAAALVEDAEGEATVVVEPPAVAPLLSAPEPEDAAAPAARPAPGRTIKFVWQMDAERRFTLVSDELIEAVGPHAAAIVGRSWREVADDLGLDPEGRVAAALERRDTWSGRTVAWPVEGEALRLPVDLAALPAFDRGRVFTGFRGFGTIRGGEPIPDPTGTGLRLAAADGTPESVSTPAEEAPVAPPAALVVDAHPLPTPAEIEAEASPPTYPDDTEVELVAEHHPVPAAPIAGCGEAAFAGEIEAEEPVAASATDAAVETADAEATSAAAVETVPPVAVADALPAVWLDDELALAMASLPTFAKESEAAPVAAVAETAEPSAAPTDEAPILPGETTVAEAEPAPLPPVSPLALLAEEAEHPIEDEALEAAWLADATRTDEAPRNAETTEAPVDVAVVSEPTEAATPVAFAAVAAEAPEAETAASEEPTAAEPASHLDTTETQAAAAEAGAAETPESAPAGPATDASEIATSEIVTSEQPASEPPAPIATPAPNGGDGSAKIVALAAATRPPADAERLSVPERVAFRQIAEALGARLEGDEAPATAPASPASSATEPTAAEVPAEPAPLVARPSEAAPRAGQPSSIETRLLDRLPGAVAVVKDDSLVYGNDAFLSLLGYPDLATLETEGGLDALFAGEHVARRWETAPDGSRPVPVLTRDGRVIPVDATVATVPWKGGSALMLTFTEVKAPQETAESEPVAAPVVAPTPAPAAAIAAPAAISGSGSGERVAELEAIIDTATDGVLMLDAEGVILSANHAAEALFGTDRKDMIGRPLTDRLAPESRRSAVDYLDGLTRNGVASVLNDGREVIGVVERGGLIPLFMTIGRISAEPARKYCAVLRDITQWKKSEEELTAARRRAEEASVHKSDFLAKISHEIRTPLNAIIGFSEVMIDERFGPIGNERYKDYLRDIHSSGSHIMSLINDLLDLSKVEAGKMDLRFEAVALGDIMSECVAMMQPQANRERIIIRSSLPAGVPAVVADPRSVRQVVLNLLSNAIKFTPSGGQVIVSTTLEDSGEVVMRVRDTGYGMTDKELQTAMEPFRQLHTTRSRGGGTGLGLPLTKALVEANRAVFRLDSTVGQGTLATVTFPVTRVLAS